MLLFEPSTLAASSSVILYVRFYFFIALVTKPAPCWWATAARPIVSFLEGRGGGGRTENETPLHKDVSRQEDATLVFYPAVRQSRSRN